jgi:capsular exopolysaccharide synthesis family protein
MTETIAFRQGGASTAPNAASRPSETSVAFASSMVTVTRPESLQAEAYRDLRTHVINQHLNLGRRALAVCAATADDGSSVVAANLAIALSQTGLNTLLVDANLAHPQIETLIRPPVSAAGLSAHLQSDAPYVDCVDARVLPNLSVIYAGRPSPTSPELLARPRFKDLIDFCLRNFDATIIDTAPANRSFGAKQVSSLLGYSLVVACKDKSFVKDVKTLAGQLSADGVTVVGSVMCGA